MNPKKDFILSLAETLTKKGKTINGQQLISELNKHGHLTNRNQLFKPGRGVYRVLKGTYTTLEKLGRVADASTVAKAFTSANGNYAYK